MHFFMSRKFSIIFFFVFLTFFHLSTLEFCFMSSVRLTIFDCSTLQHSKRIFLIFFSFSSENMCVVSGFFHRYRFHPPWVFVSVLVWENWKSSKWLQKFLRENWKFRFILSNSRVEQRDRGGLSSSKLVSGLYETKLEYLPRSLKDLRKDLRKLIFGTVALTQAAFAERMRRCLIFFCWWVFVYEWENWKLRLSNCFTELSFFFFFLHNIRIYHEFSSFGRIKIIFRYTSPSRECCMLLCKIYNLIYIIYLILLSSI